MNGANHSDQSSRDAGVVIVGGGQAGGDVAAALRLEGHVGPITIVSDEDVLPYSRPPLSKGYLLGVESQDELFIRSAKSYEAHSIDVQKSVRAAAIDPQAQEVTLSDGRRLSYDTLILATGSRPRLLPDERLLTAGNVLSLRKLGDADALRSRLTRGTRLTLIGGGYIGLEIASVAQSQGVQVTVLEAAPRLLARVASPEMAGLLARVHTEEGIDIRTEVCIADYVIGPCGDVTTVVLESGEQIPVDAVLVGIGVVPNTELAVAAGLSVENGIVVDEHLRTSDSNIYAIGDVCRFRGADGVLRRVESMPNAVGQAAAVASSIVGRLTKFEDTPWFWSDQFDLKIQIVGIAGEYDQTVIRGDLATQRTGAIFYLSGGLVKAVDVVSDNKTFALARRLVTSRAIIADPLMLADTTIPLRDHMPARTLRRPEDREIADT